MENLLGNDHDFEDIQSIQPAESSSQFSPGTAFSDMSSPITTTSVSAHSTSSDIGSTIPGFLLPRTRNRRSWIWEHGRPFFDGQGRRYWECTICTRSPKRYADGSTKHPIEHLRTLHRLTEAGFISHDGGSGPNLIQQAFGHTIPRIQFTADVFRDLLIRLLISCNLSFSHVEQPPFRLLLSYLASISPSYSVISRTLPKSGDTVRSWIMQAYEKYKAVLITQLQCIISVHISFDLWTSPNHMTFMGIVGHWIDPDTGDVRRALLGLRRLLGAHTGENQCAQLWIVLGML